MSSVRADMTRNVILLLLVFLCRTSMSYKILSVMPIPGVSHTKIPTHIMHGLAAKGHQVTVLSHFHSGENITNYKSIIFDKPSKLMVNNRDMTNFDASSIFDKFTGTTFRLLDIEKIVCQQMQTKAFQRLLNSNETYDVVLVELFNSDCMSVLADKFKAPIVGISASCPFPWVANRIGLPLDTSYSPSLLIGLSNKMTFPQRVLNTVAEIWYIFFYKYYIEPSDYHFVKQSYKDIRPTNILTERLSVLLANCHFTLAYPRTSVPGLIDIAGLVPERTAIPTNLEKWISESKHGVIYFSMGSLLRGHTLPKQKRDAFLKAFARLPQRVLWKWENDTMEDQPTNVMIQKWMPQFDILSHPNVKAFISHGGLLGTIEAVHCGVPIVVMPQFGDQHTNAKAIEANGGGVILSLNDVTEDSVYSALTTVLTPAFRRKAKQLSERFRDRPMPPLETAIYWIEYVARHKGAPHLRSAAVDMPFYQYYLLDVFGLLLLIFSVFIYLIYFMCKTVISLFRKTKVIEKEKSS